MIYPATLALIPLAYLLGSFPSAYVAGKLFKKIDITQHGSGNVGGTNAIRVLGVGPGLLVGVVDISKALLPTLWAQQLFGGNALPTLLVALGAILGHNYSVFLRFKGGKGIATTIGASVALFPQLVFWLVLLGVAVIAVTRYVSVGSMLLVTALPVALALRGASAPEVAFGAMLAVLGIYLHRSNIQRLLAVTENRIGKKKQL